MTDFQFDRRGMFKGLLAISAAGALAACGQNGDGQSQSLPDPKPEPKSGFFDASEMALLAAIGQTIIPKTETAGAVEAGVTETLQDLATDWGNDQLRAYWRMGLSNLKTALTTDAGISFEELSISDRATALAAYDAQVFDGEVEDGFYRDLKATIVQAYYMSEPGATEELEYDPVPGEWIGCVPLADYPKNWAT